MPHRHHIALSQPARYRRKIEGYGIPPANLILRSRTNYVPPSSVMLKGGKSFRPAFTIKRGGSISNNLLSTSMRKGSQMSRGYY